VIGGGLVGVGEVTRYHGNVLMTTLWCCYGNLLSRKYDRRKCYIHIYTLICRYVIFVCFCVAFLCMRVEIDIYAHIRKHRQLHAEIVRFTAQWI